jgi:hypothetical protein
VIDVVEEPIFEMLKDAKFWGMQLEPSDDCVEGTERARMLTRN